MNAWSDTGFIKNCLIYQGCAAAPDTKRYVSRKKISTSTDELC